MSFANANVAQHWLDVIHVGGDDRVKITDETNKTYSFFAHDVLLVVMQNG